MAKRKYPREVIEILSSDDEPRIPPPISKRHRKQDTDHDQLRPRAFGTQHNPVDLTERRDPDQEAKLEPVDDPFDMGARPFRYDARVDLHDEAIREPIIDWEAFVEDDGVDVLPQDIGRGRSPEVRIVADAKRPRSKDNIRNDCLEQCATVFPGIDLDHVRELFTKYDGYTDRVINDLLDRGAAYPKQLIKKDEVLPQPNDKPWIDGRLRLQPDADTKGAIVELLKNEFTEMTYKYIREKRHEKTWLYDTYFVLHTAQRTVPRPYRRAPPLRSVALYVTLVPEHVVSELRRELVAARADCEKQECERLNIERAQQSGSMGECMVCFDEFPFNRMLTCEGKVAHMLCFDCTKSYAKSEIGMSKARVVCPHSQGNEKCTSVFAMKELRKAVDEILVTKMAKLQQQEDIREAGMCDMAECPFCDYKAIYPPVNEYFVFECENPDCGKHSCRRCNRESHVPLTCDEFEKQYLSKDASLAKRHVIEEAMTSALIRTCNKCKNNFIKEVGCNKMHCSCGNTQCYVCGKNADYDHFKDRNGKSDACVLFEDIEKRHREDVETAMKTTRADIQRDFPHFTDDQLDMKMLSDFPKGGTKGLPNGIAGGVILPQQHGYGAVGHLAEEMRRRLGDAVGGARPPFVPPQQQAFPQHGFGMPVVAAGWADVPGPHFAFAPPKPNVPQAQAGGGGFYAAVQENHQRQAHDIAALEQALQEAEQLRAPRRQPHAARRPRPAAFTRQANQKAKAAEPQVQVEVRQRDASPFFDYTFAAALANLPDRQFGVRGLWGDFDHQGQRPHPLAMPDMGLDL